MCSLVYPHNPLFGSKLFLLDQEVFWFVWRLCALAVSFASLLANQPFAGASIGYSSVLFLLSVSTLTVLLTPPVVVYSPRALLCTR